MLSELSAAKGMKPTKFRRH